MTGLTISSERHRLGMTQKELAETIGVATNAVGAWERGEFEPRADNVRKLAKLFGCTPDYLLGLTEERVGFRR